MVRGKGFRIYPKSVNQWKLVKFYRNCSHLIKNWNIGVCESMWECFSIRCVFIISYNISVDIDKFFSRIYLVIDPSTFCYVIWYIEWQTKKKYRKNLETENPSSATLRKYHYLSINQSVLNTSNKWQINYVARQLHAR